MLDSLPWIIDTQLDDFTSINYIGEVSVNEADRFDLHILRHHQVFGLLGYDADLFIMVYDIEMGGF